ncbi:hypothetical protein JCM3774_001757 [Rhodotorula dairenensis]
MDWSPVPSTSGSDAAVRSTDADALLSRHAAASVGYLADPFSAHLLSPAQRRNPAAVARRPPLINIGTHARTWVVDSLVDQFLALPHSDGRCQVLSLGAGTDSRFWRLRAKYHSSQSSSAPAWPCTKWVEVDFPEATAAKARAVSTKPALRRCLRRNPDSDAPPSPKDGITIERGGLGLSSPYYALVPGDLRDLDDLADSLIGGRPRAAQSDSAANQPPRPNSSSSPPLDPSVPTLLLLECVLVYLEPETTSRLLRWFCDTFRTLNSEEEEEGESGRRSAIVAYDPFRLQDQFGTIMKRNLALRSLTLPGAESTPTLSSLTDRLVAAGCTPSGSGALSIKQIRDDVIPVDELERVTKIEQIDEVEELNLVLEHYAVSWGTVAGPDNDSDRGDNDGTARRGICLQSRSSKSGVDS